jgi:KTSC domain-containing protein
MSSLVSESVSGKGGSTVPRVISRETPNSREIEGVVYLAQRQDLWVYFRSGAVNVYLEVDAAMWEAFETAESKDDFIRALRSYRVLFTGKKPE